MEPFHKKSSELQGNISSSLARVVDDPESLKIHKAVSEKLEELVTLRAQDSNHKGRPIGGHATPFQNVGQALIVDELNWTWTGIGGTNSTDQGNDGAWKGGEAEGASHIRAHILDAKVHRLHYNGWNLSREVSYV